MPRRLAPLGARWNDREEINRCISKAGRAVPKGSPLNDGDIRFLALVAMDGLNLMEGSPVADEDGNLPRSSKSELSENKSRDLAWIFYRDPVGAARALLAAEAEVQRIAATPLWRVRRRLRWLCIERSFPVGKWRTKRFDMQTVREAIGELRTPSGARLSVSDSLIKKALRLERMGG